jgi:type I restriction enzyme S subunit
MSVALGGLVDSVETWNPESDAPDEFFEYIDLSAIDQESKAIVAARELPCAEAPSRARQIVAAGDVLVSTVRPNLNGVARVPSRMDGATASTGLCVLRPRPEKLHGAYLFHWVRSPGFIAEMVRRATGASYPAVSDRIVFESKLPLPPLPDQQRIAEALDRAEALQTKRRAALAELDTLTQSLFLDMFGNPMRNPKGWPERRLDSVCNLVNGRAFEPDEWEGEGLPIIRIQNLNDATKPFNYSRRALPERFRVKTGDILFSWSGTPGTSFGCFRWNRPEGWLNQHIFNVHLNGDLVGDFFISQLNLKLGELIAKAHGGVGLQHVTKRMVDETMLMVPPLLMQRLFADHASQVEALKVAHCASLAELDALFASLQHRAFQGEL